MSTSFRQIKSSIQVLIYLFVMLVSILLLSSYSDNDVAWLYYAEQSTSPNNIFGTKGAYITDIAYMIFGWVIWLLPMAMLWEIILIWVYANLPQPAKPILLYRIIGYAMVVLFAMMVVQLVSGVTDLPNQRHLQGGIIGYEMSTALSQTVGRLLAMLIAAIGLVATIAYTVMIHKTGFSTWLNRSATSQLSLEDVSLPIIDSSVLAAHQTTAQSDSAVVSDKGADENSESATEAGILNYLYQLKPKVSPRQLFDRATGSQSQSTPSVATGSANSDTIELQQRNNSETSQPVSFGDADSISFAPKHDIEPDHVEPRLTPQQDKESTNGANEVIPFSSSDLSQLFMVSQSTQSSDTVDSFAAPELVQANISSVASPELVDTGKDTIKSEETLSDKIKTLLTTDSSPATFESRDNTASSIEVDNSNANTGNVDNTVETIHAINNSDHQNTQTIAEFQVVPEDSSDNQTEGSRESHSADTSAQTLPTAKANQTEHEHETTESHLATQPPHMPPDNSAVVNNTVSEYDIAVNDGKHSPEATLEKQPKSAAMQTAVKRQDLPKLPPLSILDKPDPNRKPSYSKEELIRLSELLEIKLQDFNVKASVIDAQPGPVVTRFEVDLAPGIKASKVTGIARDLARSLSMASVRVVEVIPGKPYIGIEVPNKKREMVRLIELLNTEDYQNPKAQISMAMGKDIAGRPVITDLARAPHMLVAGTTGSGKSVLVNSMLLSMLLKYTPTELRLILIDPKQLELANYNDVPHLLTPVITDMTEAASGLAWCVQEMERRYQLMALFKVRKLGEFNKKVLAAEQAGEPILDPLWRPNDSVSLDRAPKLQPLPMIVIVADEFADMIMQVGKQAEELITRLAQKSRAAGIHLMLATQRPSVDVITGLIKANVPVRAALRVNSKVDSRTILDTGGAEDMLGNGDMLFLGPGQIEADRVHGAYVSDEEVNRVCDAWRERGTPEFIDITTNYLDNDTDKGSSGGGSTSGEDDALYDEAVAFVLETRKISASSLQRKFSIGYNRAARIVDSMEEAGLVGPMGKGGKRELLM